MYVRFLAPSLIATGVFLMIGAATPGDSGLRAAFVEVGGQTELPLERVALGIGEAASRHSRAHDAPAEAIPAEAIESTDATEPTRAARGQRKRLMRLQATPAVRRVRGDYKYWT